MIGDELADRLMTFGVRTGGHVLSRALLFAAREIVTTFYHGPGGGSVSMGTLNQSQSAAVQGIEISRERAGEFDHFARKYGFQYSLLQEENDPQKYFLTFRQRDINLLEMAVTDMMHDKTREWGDLTELLEQAKDRAFQVTAPAKKLEQKGKEIMER